jgi:hypothetical protein
MSLTSRRRRANHRARTTPRTYVSTFGAANISESERAYDAASAAAHAAGWIPIAVEFCGMQPGGQDDVRAAPPPRSRA